MINPEATKFLFSHVHSGKSLSEQDVEPDSSAGVVLWLRGDGAVWVAWTQLCMLLCGGVRDEVHSCYSTGK